MVVRGTNLVQEVWMHLVTRSLSVNFCDGLKQARTPDGHVLPAVFQDSVLSCRLAAGIGRLRPLVQP